MKKTVYVDTYVDGILDPEQEMIGPVVDGGYIIANTTPGCWGPMITPELKGAHEVTQPVFVKDAQIGDSILVHIKSIDITSTATTSGVHELVNKRYIGDAAVAAKCEYCGKTWPKSEIIGVGNESIKCVNCGMNVSPYRMENGYTMTLDLNKKLGLTVNKENARIIAENGEQEMAIPDNSIQNPAVKLAPYDLKGVVSKIRPFLGQLGTIPSIAIPDSRNAGDLGTLLIDAPHKFSLNEDQLKEHSTDGHMDINKVREGSILICPVKVKGGGIYLGDMHAMQGEGEIAGHTADVAGVVILKVEVLKGMKIDGPILLPLPEDLPFLAKPLSYQELEQAKGIGYSNNEEIEISYPLSFIGTGSDLNKATDNALKRASKLLSMSISEVRNRCTISGAIEIGRHPGVVLATFRIPELNLKNLGVLKIVKNQYINILK